MKLKELSPNADITKIKVKIPDAIEIPAYGTAPQREVYLVGWMGETMMVKISLDSDRMYPILEETDFKEWEVVENKK